MVRVLRPDRPPEESSLTGEEKLEAQYGCGKFLLEQNVYLCALPARLRQSLEEINSAPTPPPISTSLSRWLAKWSSDVRVAVIEECSAEVLALNKAIEEVVSAMQGLDKEWAECVRRAAAAAAPGQPLLLVTPPSPPQVQQEVADSVKSALSRGWKLEYKDPLGVVDYLGGVVDGYMAEWALGQYHAAWTMVLQSSGWGKSRSIQELATKGFHVAYVSFTRHGATGFPGRSGFADVLTSIGSDTRDPRCIAAWVVAILSQIKDASPENWRETQESFVREVSQRYKELKEDVTRTVRHQSPSPGEHWFPDQLRQWIRINLGSILKGESGRENGESEMKVVFCLDEAASLFKEPSTTASNEPSTPFLAFRRFFSAIPKRVKLFGLVAGTARKLGMVFPERMFDPSARAVDPTAKFFQPVWMVGCALREPEKLRRLMSEQKDVAAVSEDFTRELFKMGRPLWRTVLDNDAKGAFVHLDDAVEFASQKLLDGVAPNKKLLITEAMAAAIIGVVAGLEVAAWAELAQRMVCGHMRSVSHVIGDVERVFTGDVIEPILGEAAAHVLADVEVLLGVLQTMCGLLKQGLVVEGRGGEIVGRLLLVLAMHHCCRLRKFRSHETYSHPVPLGSFLSVLCGRAVTAEGFIFFNRFMFLNRREIDGKLLLFCFVCGFAIIPTRNQTGFDVLLPWLVPGPDGNYQLLPDRMRAVPVQFRNRGLDLPEHFGGGRPPKKQRTVAEEEEIKMGDECGLYLHVKGKRAVEHQVDITEDSKVLVLRGLRFPFLEERVPCLL